MAQSKKTGFKTIESDLEQLDEKLREHRRKQWTRGIIIALALIIILVLWNLISALRSYDDYDVRSSEERIDSEAAQFMEFQGKILEYSNDGSTYMYNNDQQIWNQSYEMTTPKVDVCEGYLSIYDQGGTDIFIMTENGTVKEINVTMPIQTVCVANQGTVAVLMRQNETSYIRLYDRNGEELASGEFYAEQGGFPVDIALSNDAQKLAVDMIDVNDGSMKSTITFYNFGSVGQNEIDNNVGTYSYSDVLIPNIEYVSDNRMIAFGDTKIIIFEGSQKPAVAQEITLEQQLESVFYNEKYVGIVYANTGEEISHHIQVYDMNGSVVMEHDTAMSYTSVQFLANNEICVTNDYECELYTIHSIRKFSYTFETRLYQILSGSTRRSYTFILDGTTEEVRLK